MSAGDSDTARIRVVLPYHLRILAQVSGELQLDVARPVTQKSILDAVEKHYPMLCGTIRDQVTLKRRAFLRYYACQQDLSLEEIDAPVPEAVATGKEPYLIISAIAGG
jgi:sulfur-carrier protein